MSFYFLKKSNLIFCHFIILSIAVHAEDIESNHSIITQFKEKLTISKVDGIPRILPDRSLAIKIEQTCEWEKIDQMVTVIAQNYDSLESVATLFNAFPHSLGNNFIQYMKRFKDDPESESIECRYIKNIAVPEVIERLKIISVLSEEVRIKSTVHLNELYRVINYSPRRYVNNIYKHTPNYYEVTDDNIVLNRSINNKEGRCHIKIYSLVGIIPNLKSLILVSLSKESKHGFVYLMPDTDKIGQETKSGHPLQNEVKSP